MIDLHCHSHYSDGMLSPQELLAFAVNNKIEMLALTDHDTLQGVIKLRSILENSPLTLINGIEISVRWKKHDIHILGLNIRLDDAGLDQLILSQQQARRTRALEISHQLSLLGVENAFEKACAIAGHDNIARPHFAKVLVMENKVPEMGAAFKKYLVRGKPAYIETNWASMDSTVQCIKSAGGQAVIAHPKKYKLTNTKLSELITDFKNCGGDGLEIISGDTNIKDSTQLAGFAERFNLLSSTGSDFHGFKISSVMLGRQRELPVNCVPIWHQWTS